MPDSARKWFKLDNAAKIYPASMRRRWMSLFRMSAHLTEPVDPEILAQALRSALPRFPGFSVHLRRGLFWFYLQHTDDTPDILEDVANPCVPIDLRRNKNFMFRVRYYGCRISLEVFHALSDGTGGLCFLNTLVAEYLRLRYGAAIPRSKAILDCGEAPKAEELEDAFLKYAGDVITPRREADAYYLGGHREPPEIIHITTGIIPVEEVLSRAKAKGVTLTEYLTAVLILSIDSIQRREGKRQNRRKPIKVCVPVNLRAFFPSATLRNFSLFVNPGIESRLGRFSFDEVLRAVHHHMGSEATEKNLRARFAANVQSERSKLVRITPLFLKNVIMRIVFARFGDRKTSSTLTNLGRVDLPEEMSRYITRMDLILGPLSRNPVVCAALTYNGALHCTFTRNITDSAVEREFFCNLVKLGIPVKVESNNRSMRMSEKG